MPFQVGLGRLLRKARPDRLFIEPSGLGHPRQLLQQLGQAPWQAVLAVQPLVMVLDAQALAKEQPLPEAQQAALSATALVVFNKSASVDEAKRLLITARFPGCRGSGRIMGPCRWTACQVCPQSLTSTQLCSGWLWANLSPHRQRCGQIHPSRSARPVRVKGLECGLALAPQSAFRSCAVERLFACLAMAPGQGVIHSQQGWQSFNGLEGHEPEWQPSEWRRDSRMELIFAQAQPLAELQAALAACRLGG
jgi:G3E family GTPase